MSPARQQFFRRRPNCRRRHRPRRKKKLPGADPAGTEGNRGREAALLAAIVTATQEARGLELRLQVQWELVARLTAEFDQLIRQERVETAQRERSLEMAVRPYLLLQDLNLTRMPEQWLNQVAGNRPQGLRTVGEILSDPGPAFPVGYQAPLMLDRAITETVPVLAAPLQFSDSPETKPPEQVATESKPGSDPKL